MPLGAGQICYVDASLLVARADDLEVQKMFLIRQEFQHASGRSPFWVARPYRNRVVALVIRQPKDLAGRRPDQNHTITIPRAAVRKRLRQRLYGAAIHVESLEKALHIKGDRAAVGRPERKLTTFGMWK